MAEEKQNERLIIFSDGVMAVSITLLVLDVRLPGDAAGLGQGELLAAIIETLPRVYAYALSFLVVALYWSSHNQKFVLIPRTNMVLVWLNVIFLLAIGLVPFVTSVIAENGGVTATVVYAGLMAVIGLALTLIWGYAWVAGLISDTVDEEHKRAVFWISAAGSAAFALSIPIAFWNADAGKYFWLLLIPISLGRFATHRRIARSMPK